MEPVLKISTSQSILVREGELTRLEHVAEHAKHAVETLILFRVVFMYAPGDAHHQLGDDDQIDDQRRCQQRILADVEDAEKQISDGNGSDSDRNTYLMVWCPPMKISA